MRQITINIPDNKFQFFVELVQQLGFETNEEPVVPEWQKQVVRQRMNETPTSAYMTWEEVEQKLKLD